MNLGTVATIRSGLVLSRKLSREISSYRYPLLNLRAIHPDGYILSDSLEVFYATEPLRQDYLTQQGDIIIRLSVPYTAILIDTDMTGIVVSSNFVIIRLNKKYMLPEYLLWLLNTPDIKKKIYESSSSNMLSAVRPTFFAELEVLLLSLADQEKIAKLNLLAKQETQLLKNLADEKERYYTAVIDRAQKKHEEKNTMTTRKDIEQVLWNACDSFRGKIDSSRYKDYILSMLFVKYLSDVSNERREGYIKQYDGDIRRVERAMSRERFAMDTQSTFDFLYANRNDAEIGQRINVALNHIEEHNSGKLRNVFRAIDFNSQVDFGEPKEKNATLRNLLEDFNALDLRPSQLGSADIIGDAYEYMIAMFASDAGKKGGEFFTPSQVSELVASLVQPRENDRIYDPTCGSGGLLLKAYKKVTGGKAAIYGQEKNQQTWALCTMNMFLHSVDDARIWQGDTLSNPQNIENDALMKFQVVVANPPFSLDKWDSGFLSEAEADSKGKKKMAAELDSYHRFDWGVPPASKGDYAFVLHMLSSLDAENGRMAVVLPHGVLFRGASEGKIRRQLVEMNLLDAVIGLPANLFYGTGIPACILVFKKKRPRRDVLFIDASGDGNFEKGKNQNILRDCDIDRIVSTYEARETVDKYSHVASFDEIKENDFNLNIPRYVDTFEEDELVDIDEVQRNIANIEEELTQVQAQMKKYLEELGL